jgi:hypothetical protein
MAAIARQMQRSQGKGCEKGVKFANDLGKYAVFSAQRW